MRYDFYAWTDGSGSCIHSAEFNSDEEALAYAEGLDPSHTYTVEAIESTYIRVVTSENAIEPSLDEAESRCKALNIARDRLTGLSPLDVPGIGVFDYDPTSREKLAVAQRFLAAMDTLYPAEPPHSTPWTLSDNSQVDLNLTSFAQIDIASAVRGYTLHQACLRAKAAIRAGQEPDPADLALLT